MISALSCLFVAITVLLGSGWLAFSTGDPQWVNRGGALITALAVALVVYEAFFEERFRAKNPERARVADHPAELTLSLPMKDLEERVRLQRRRTLQKKHSIAKLRLIILNSSIAVFGEVIQGFGDLIFKFGMALGGHDRAAGFFRPIETAVRTLGGWMPSPF